MVPEMSEAPSFDYAVGKSFRGASHTCCVYRLPRESASSTVSSVVTKSMGPAKGAVTAVTAGIVQQCWVQQHQDSRAKAD